MSEFTPTPMPTSTSGAIPAVTPVIPAIPFAPTITIVGLGPGTRRHLTVEALDVLRDARRVYVHASDQPLINELSARGDLRPDVVAEVLASADSKDVVGVLDALVQAAGQGPLVYAARGYPLQDPSIITLLQESTARDIAFRLAAGLAPAMPGGTQRSSLEIETALHSIPAREAIGYGVASTAEQGLQALWTGLSSRLLNAQVPLLIEGRITAAELEQIAAWLLTRYPDTHAVSLLYEDPETEALTARVVTLAQLDTVPDTGQARAVAALYVPPLASLDDVRAPNTLGYIAARLRAPDGCPWDREQTHASLTPYMIEEAYEAVDAIERDDDDDMVEELGDVLLQVVLHSQLAEEAGRFNLADVAEEVNRKLVRRHPHVFGDIEVSGSSEVLRNWEQIKRVEKGERRASVLDGIPPALPALLLAQTVSRKAAKVGFDWPDAGGALDKVREEIAEVKAATTDEERREELGDLFFALTSVCRHLGVDAEDALRAAVRKFSSRFRRVEADAQARNLDLTALSVPELDVLWDAAKAGE